MADVFDLSKKPLHLGLGATATVQPEFTGMEWYADYSHRNAGDGVEGRLVTLGSFSEPWDMWEMHPHGEELVLCLSGEIALTQERDGETKTVTLRPNEGIVNAAGVWHTADVDAEASCLFITAGHGTEHRPR